ncbi:MAG: RNA pyrophosphohydrolase [Pikeienuella sp.]
MAIEAGSALPYRPCVGVMLINPAGRVFAGQRIDNPGDAWQMPQGGIDQGERPRTAALRELGEETGVVPDLVEILGESAGWHRYDLPPELLGRIWGGRYRGQEQKWFAMRFLGSDADIRIETAEPEFSRWAWMDSAQLIDCIVPFKRDIYRAVFAEFADLIACR